MTVEQHTPTTPASGLARLFRPHHGALARREAFTGFSFIGLWIFGLIAFTLGPIIAVFYLSFTDYPIIGAPTWIGLNNYRRMFTEDPLFYKSLNNTAFYVGLRVIPFQIFAFFLALLVNQKLPGMRIFRTGIYLPVMISTVATSIMWRFFLGQAGLANYVLFLFGLPRQNIMANEMWAKPILVLLTLWVVGPAMIIYLAGLQGIPRSLYEAAEIDGATSWARLFFVTVPMMTPVILLNSVMDLINSFQVFTYAFIISEGGPLNATLFFVLYIYRQSFQYFSMGYASALSTVLFVIILILTLLFLKWSDSWVQYDRI